jgi:hypothetical protein
MLRITQRGIPQLCYGGKPFRGPTWPSERNQILTGGAAGSLVMTAESR